MRFLLTISTMSASKKILRGTAVLAFWLVIWQAVAMIANRGLIIGIPTPITTAGALLRLISKSSFWYGAASSLGRIVLGFLIAAVMGVICAVLAYKLPVFKTLTAPVLQVIRAVPVAAFIIVVYLWLRDGAIPVFIAFLMVFPLMWSNTGAGLDSIDKNLVEMARVMELSRAKTFRHIVLPAMMPSLSSALITGLGFAWKSGVAAEVICRTEYSVGNMLWASKTAIDYDEVFALTVVIVILSVGLEALLKLLLGRYCVDKNK